MVFGLCLIVDQDVGKWCGRVGKVSGTVKRAEQFTYLSIDASGVVIGIELAFPKLCLRLGVDAGLVSFVVNDE